MTRERKKVRTSLSLSADVFESLKRISEKTGLPVSNFVDEALAGALPQLEMMADAMALATSDPARALRLLSDAVDETVADVEEKHNEIKKKRQPREVKARA